MTDADTGGRRRLMRAAFWVCGGLLVAAAVVYGIFWLPYRNPGETPPRVIQILPPAVPAGTAQEAAPDDYGWVDREAGVVRIPVEEAMAALAGKLPVRPDADEFRGDRRSAAPTDAGSGRPPVRDER